MLRDRHDLKRSLGPVQLAFYGVGTIVGAGIYSVIGAAAGVAGRGVWLSFVLASIAALLTALSYAELSAMLPRSRCSSWPVRCWRSAA